MPDATLEQTVAALVSLAADANDKLPTRAALIDKLALPPTPLTLNMAIYGQARTDAAKVLAANKIPVVAKTLDSSLVDLFMAGSMDKTMYRYDKRLMGLIKQSQGYTPPQEGTIQKLVTVLAQCEHQGVLAISCAHAITVRTFLESGQARQIETINALWNECTVEGVYNVAAKDMHEPAGDVNLLGVSQLPSSVHPEADKSHQASKFKRGHDGKPFTKLGVGFRIEGSFDSTKGEGPDKLKSSITRVSTSGMVPQVTLNWLMLENGKNIEGTTVGGHALAPRLNIAQKDLWNESGVCVARSFFGATAFPLRGHKGQAILWAVDVTGLTGYDTEDWQLQNPGTGAGPWRPGEKCFGRISAKHILAYIVIEKLGDEEGGWKFAVPRGSKWKFVNPGTPSQNKYIEDELSAWAGVIATVPTLFDFQQ